jgi:hypothetical protein
MAYLIFLKYLRSLEEFRKNPHVKIPPKSPCANFQSLGIFKILIFIQKEIFFRFRPIRPSPAPRWPALPRRPPAPRSAHSAQAALAYFLKGVFSSTLRTPVETPCLSLTPPKCGARLSASSPSPRWPTIASSSRRLQPPRAARPPTSGRQARSSLHALIPPLNFPP